MPFFFREVEASACVRMCYAARPGAGPCGLATCSNTIMDAGDGGPCGGSPALPLLRETCSEGSESVCGSRDPSMGFWKGGDGILPGRPKPWKFSPCREGGPY